ncbi:MAG TPA: tetratricopeptide repeat protein [Streptosporangiaceae bacterium]|nr:tetratricopeptide repeat protein [Streptosporangiaceae bacterium]
MQRLLDKRGLSWRKLAELTFYDPSWLSKVRHGATPSAELVRRCDEVLRARGSLIALAGIRQERRPAQLPAAPAGFVGRAEELARIRRALIETHPTDTLRVVAIEGLPGVGKTSTALHGAHALVTSKTRAFADGQLYVDLQGHSREAGPRRPYDVLEEFLIALGVSASEVPVGDDQRSALYRSLLASREVLIVLDNAASSVQVEPLLPGSAGCGVLVTSRRRLVGLSMRVGVVRIVLGVLTPAESTKVLREVIGDARADAEAPALRVLAEECGHLPLALRIAGERVAAHPHRPLSELVEELTAEQRRLDALAMDDAIPVREVFEWSFRDLGDAEARVFQLLALHPGANVSVDAVAALAGTPTVQTRRVLETLCDFHLLNAAPGGRYRFHDLLRHYATERVKAGDPAERLHAVGRLTNWYLHTAAAAGRALAPFRLNPLELPPVAADVVPLTFDNDRAALRWCDGEAANFEPIIGLAVDAKLYDTAWKLAVALFDYHRLLRNSGHMWLAATTLAYEATRAAEDPYAEGWVQTSRAEAHRWLRRYDDAQDLFEHALTIRREVGDRHGEGWTLAGLGFLAIDQGRPEEARTYAQQALFVFTEVADHNGRASALFTLADVYSARRQTDHALRMLSDSLKIFEEIENHDGQGLTLVKIAEIHTGAGRHQEALDHLDRSLNARHQAGSRWGEADALARRGHVLNVLGRSEEARRSWSAAAAMYEQLHDPRAADIRAYLRGNANEPVLPPPAW